jgi:hypothetical protein
MKLTLKTVVTAVVILLVVGCVATAIAYPFIGRTSPPGPDPGGDPGVVDPEPDPDPDPEPDPDPDPGPGQVLEPIPRPQYVRGLFLTGHGAGAKKLREPVLQVIRDSELNAVVVNIKDDEGYITHGQTQVPLANEAKANQKQFDVESFMEQLRQDNIYPIARIVVAKDKHVYKVHPDWFFKEADGSVWKAKGNVAWADLRNRGYWDYILDIAEEAVEMGFREIQFDYVRWPSSGDGAVSKIANNLPSTGEFERSQVIVEFLAYARERLGALGIDLSADLFGIMGTAKDEQNVGQQLELMLSSNIHAISPMMYPSHYGKNTYGFPVPDAEPYGTILQSSKDHLVRMEAVQSQVILRPWLQDFTVNKDIKYGIKEVQAELKALKDLGIKEYLFWNAGNKYTEEAYRTWKSE